MDKYIKYSGLLQGRREFAKTLTLGSAGIALAPFINGCASAVPKLHKSIIRALNMSRKNSCGNDSLPILKNQKALDLMIF